MWHAVNSENNISLWLTAVPATNASFPTVTNVGLVSDIFAVAKIRHADPGGREV
jgi:hypothetical protein